LVHLQHRCGACSASYCLTLAACARLEGRAHSIRSCAMVSQIASRRTLSKASCRLSLFTKRSRTARLQSR
jgi:hypothetical protein